MSCNSILVGVSQLPPTRTQIAALEQLAYLYQGELGILGRHFFRKGNPRTHHLHLVLPESEIWEKHLLFRDFLRKHPAAAQQYEALKRQLAMQYRLDRDGYVTGKSHLVEKLLAQARAWWLTG